MKNVKIYDVHFSLAIPFFCKRKIYIFAADFNKMN